MTPELGSLLAELVVDKVLSTVQQRAAGHCIRVDELPSGLASDACERLQSLVELPNVVRLVASSPAHGWEVTPTQAVSLRNRDDKALAADDENGEATGVLVLFIPAGSRLTVEDSIGATTFETLNFRDLGKRAVESALAKAYARNPDGAPIAEQVASQLSKDARYECDEISIADYLLAVAEGPNASAAGTELTRVGLIPDRGLISLPLEQIPRQLQLNDQQMRCLAVQEAPAERLRNLPIDRSASSSQELIEALQVVLRDGLSDRFEIAARLSGSVDEVDYARWGPDVGEITVKRFEITGLHGDDFTNGGTEPTIETAEPSIGVRFICDPAPAAIPGLGALRLEILEVGRDADDLHETGISATKTALPRTTSSSWKKKVVIGDPEAGLDAGLYRFRLVLIAEDNSEIRDDLSEIFRIGEELNQSPTVAQPVLGLVDSKIEAIRRGVPPTEVGSPILTLAADATSHGFTIRYQGSGRAWAVSRPKLLADLEASLIRDAHIRGYEIDMEAGITEERWLEYGTALPQAFTDARTALFGQLKENQLFVGSDSPSVATSDLAKCEAAIQTYVETWVECLKSAEKATRLALLSTDQIHVLEDNSLVAVLLAPTHPLRLCWLARCSSVLEEWVSHAIELDDDELAVESAELCAILDQLVPLYVPPVLVENDAAFIAGDSLTREWGLWCPVSATDRMAITSRVRSRFGLAPWRLGASGEDALRGTVRAYLDAHPYVRRLVVNVVQPGEAELLLRLLDQLQEEVVGGEMSFVFRLFGDTADASLGRALDSFMADPDGSLAVHHPVAEGLTRPSLDPLTPKLSYSKHSLASLLEGPEAYTAHISLFLDFFDVTVAPVPEPPVGRSFFAGGVLIEPVQRYLVGDEQRAPRWMNAISGDGLGLLSMAFRAVQNSTAELMRGTGINPAPALQLEVDSVSQALLDAVHRSSDWVVVIDPVFSDEFLDSPTGDGPSPYIIDMQSGANRPGGRNVLVSTRSRDELASPLLDAASRIGFSIGEHQSLKLMESLRTLGAGVALRLMMDERRAKEALSLALASVHLDVTGILRHALVIPVDLHYDLFREGLERGASATVARTDLAIFQIDPSLRKIGIHLVEVKLRSSLGAAGEVPAQLVEDIRDQLTNTERILLNRLFGQELRQRRYSLPGAIQLRRLTILLRHYLGRALRHGLIDEADAQPMRNFIESLDNGFEVGTSLHGLIFHADAPDCRNEEYDGVQLTVVGRDYVRELLADPARAKTVLAGGSDEEYMQTVFKTISDWTPVIPSPELESAASDASEAGPAEGEEITRSPDGTGPALEDVDLLGAVATSDQFGIIGVNTLSKRPVAIDVGGTNVVSVFGVQGSGKSYTVGALLEAGLLREPNLNRLPAPLGGVVFHYSGDQSYVPEFASMVEPNHAGANDLDEFDSAPKGIEDLVVLVPRALLDRRRAEYDGITVEPILLGPDELQLADWKHLMGIGGGNQMYAKNMQLILGSLRDSVTIDKLRTAIEDSDLTANQKTTAQNRIKFVEPYVQSGQKIASVMRPGRLVIVDLRDELVDKGEALSLFMVLLNRFTQAGYEERKFNKMVVFDEAHKYMDDPALTDAITEAVREMRHKGASIIVASQNPPSVPQEIIELSTVIVAHKFNSPAWLRHLQKVIHAFNDMKGSQFTHLGPGQAYVWASGNPKYQRPTKIQMRPRLTRHGGATRQATE